MPDPASEPRDLLQTIPIFAGLAPAELEALAKLSATKRLQRGQVLFRRGDRERTLYLVIQGRLRVLGEGLDGKEVTFDFMDPGDVIGEIGFLDSDPRSATVDAWEPCELLVIHARDLDPFLTKNPRVAINMAATLAGRVRRLSTFIEDTLFLTLPSRLAKRLLALADEHGRQMLQGVRIEMRLPQQQLGEMLGVTRESINKQLRAWSDEGVLRTRNAYITLLDQERLRELAHTHPLTSFRA